MKPIHKEHFEAWLFSQPDDRQFRYSDNKGCFLCCFLKEQGVCDEPSVGDKYWRNNGGQDWETRHYFEGFLDDFMYHRLGAWMHCSVFTAKAAKEGYRKLFNFNPETYEQSNIGETRRVAAGCDETGN